MQARQIIDKFIKITKSNEVAKCSEGTGPIEDPYLQYLAKVSSGLTWVTERYEQLVALQDEEKTQEKVSEDLIKEQRKFLLDTITDVKADLSVSWKKVPRQELLGCFFFFKRHSKIDDLLHGDKLCQKLQQLYENLTATMSKTASLSS